jgi:hypothetical protein
MSSAVKIEEGKYGSAIMLLVRLGGNFATKYERTLIVNSEQKRALEKAGFVAAKKFSKRRVNRTKSSSLGWIAVCCN